jgi:hypothetical protein
MIEIKGRKMNFAKAALITFLVLFLMSASHGMSFAECNEDGIKLYDESIKALEEGYYNSAKELFIKLHSQCYYKEFDFFMAYINDQQKNYFWAMNLYKEYLDKTRPGDDYRDFAIKRYDMIKAAAAVPHTEETDVYAMSGRSDEKVEIRENEIPPVKGLPKVYRHRKKYLVNPPKGFSNSKIIKKGIITTH